MVTVTMMLSVADALLISDPSVAKLPLLLILLLVVVAEVVVVSKTIPLLNADEAFPEYDVRNTARSDTITTNDVEVATCTMCLFSHDGCCRFCTSSFESSADDGGKSRGTDDDEGGLGKTVKLS